MSAAEKIEALETTANVTSLPCFSIRTFREFMQDEKVWGKQDQAVELADMVIHVRDNSVITSYATSAGLVEQSESIELVEDLMLQEHTDKATVYIESGTVSAVNEHSLTRYVRTLKGDPTFAFNGRKHSNQLADIIQAREVNSPKDLVI